MSAWPRNATGWLVVIASLGIALSHSSADCAGGSACASTGSPPLQPRWIQVDGGEEAWHADNLFTVRWENPPPTGQPLLAAHYRVLDSQGAVAVVEKKISWAIHNAGVVLPNPIPGVYTFEVWMEDTAGAQGPPATAKLRIDGERPGPVEPARTSGWIGRTAIPYAVRLRHPASPLPVSGLRGYALSVDPTSEAEPCAAPDRCSDAETDLRGGIEDDRYAIPALQEGTNYVHVVAVSGSGMKSVSTGVTVLHVDKTDPVTTLSGAPAGWTNQPVALTARASDALSGMTPDGYGEPFTAIRLDGGAPKTAIGNSVSTTVIAAGVHTIAYYARDAAGNLNDGGDSNGIANASPSKIIIRIDKEPPKAAFANAQSPEDPEMIEARVLDSQSGPDPSRGRIALRPVGSSEEFTALRTEAVDGKLMAHWDSDDYPPGEYEFRATAYDAAGNVATSAKRINGVGMVLSNPLKTPTEVHAGFGGRVLAWNRCAQRHGQRRCHREVIERFAQRPKTRFVPYGRGMLFSGRLSGSQNAPLSQMPVQVIERFGAGTSLVERVTTVKTGGDGFFATRLAPGPSRDIAVVFPGNRTLSRSATAAVHLGVRTGVRMRASARIARIGGRPIVFSGVVESGEANIPPDGKSVQLQFRLPHLPWSEFRSVQTDAHGRFRYAYSFTDDDSRGVGFEFRALVPEQSGWPYEPASSKPLVVRGR